MAIVFCLSIEHTDMDATLKYYNKEYREGEPREFLPTAAVGIDRTRRVRSIPTAKFGKNSRGTIPTVFLYFIYRS